MARKKQIHAAKHHHLRPVIVSLSPTDEMQIQEQLQNYQEIAQLLPDVRMLEQVSEAIAPIIAMPESAQISFARELSKEANVASANVLNALYTASPAKEARKEARRLLIRLETSRVYPSWEPPAPRRQLPILEEIAEPGATQETLPVPINQNGPGTVQKAKDNPAGLLDLLLGKTRQRAEINEDGEFDFSDLIADEVIEDFLAYWSEGSFEQAYAMLSDHSPLRENLTQDAWVARRRAWFEHYQPHDLEMDEYSDLERTMHQLQAQPFLQEVLGQHKETPTEESTDTQDSATHREQVTTFWSLALKELPREPTLPEFPVATLVNQESGRHWFWTVFRFVEEDDAWHIFDMVDEGVKLHTMSVPELEQAIEDVKASATKLMKEMAGTDEEDEEQNEEPAFFKDGDPLGMGEASRLKSELMYYNDALLSNGPDAYESYIRAIEQAVTTRQYQRSDVYSRLTRRRFPDRTGDIFRSEAKLFSTFSDTLRNLEEVEEAAALATIAESRLRAIIKFEPERAANYIALLEELDRRQKLEREPEMRELVQQAQALAREPRDLALVEIGLGRLAQLDDNEIEALDHYRQATERDPSYEEAWYALGHLQHTLSQNEEAEQSLLRCLALNPQRVNAYVDLVTIYRQRDEYDQAHVLLDQVMPLIDRLTSAPGDVASLHVAASLLSIDEGNREKAYEQIDQAVTLAPEMQSVKDAQEEFQRRFSPRIAVIEDEDEDEPARRAPRPKKRKKKR